MAATRGRRRVGAALTARGTQAGGRLREEFAQAVGRHEERLARLE
ncbi:MAG: hypothetical protein OXD50_11645 [Chloroflexi bacterium]|nr:hypothetical protein [Chloroflexota bacterium]